MRQRTQTKVWTAAAVAVLLGAGAAADGRKATALLREAEVKDTVLGDVKGAIALYERAVAEAAGDRATAARALLALATAEQKIGDAAAREAYERVVRDFADQREYASAAKARLAALGARVAQSGDAVPQRLLALEDWVQPGVVTDDGRTWITGHDGDMVAYDVATGVARPFVPNETDFAHGYPALSPNGRQVAYVRVERPAPVLQRRPLLMVAPISGGTAKAVAQSPDGVHQLVPVGWSADGKAVLVRATSNPAGDPATSVESLIWFAVSDGAVRVAHRFAAGAGAFGAALSPDGRFVAYTTRTGTPDTRLTVLDLQSDVESQVVKWAASSLTPVWTTDGSHLLFVSNRGGNRSLWGVAVHDGVSGGEPFQVLPGDAFAFPVRVTPSGTLLFTREVGGGVTTFVMERNGSELRPTGSFAGMSSSLSPDGKQVAAIVSDASDNDLVVRTIDSGEERRYTFPGLGVASPRWLPDGEHLLVIARVGSSGPAFYALARSTGQFTRLFAVDTADLNRSTVGTLSGDGRTLYLCARPKGTGVWTQIVAVDVATGTTTASFPIPGGLAQRGNPGLALSPDGSTIAAEGADTATLEGRIVTVSLVGGASHDAARGFPLASAPDKMRWANAGSLLFLAGTTSLDWSLMGASPTGGAPRIEYDPRRAPNAAHFDAPPFFLDLSKDGGRLVLGGNVRPRVELWSFDITSALNGK